ncbi:hypothetical protein RND71_006187 [Anisodus tanguticus]|uniref:Uncharacterized protein n=1 Tax=Anisodus tanguticus TaxID=243964 RepID=A0AAE1SSW4_9SOLA|nr:hypothetical protein RND71_006187 [Anisodus tanguticus]
MMTREAHVHNSAYKRASQKFSDAGKAMWMALKCEYVWRTCIYMYISLALSLHIHEGMFYWYTDAKDGPSFSKEMVGSISSVGAVGSLHGVLLYQNAFKNHPFRGVLFWTQLLYASWGGGLLLHAFNVTRTQFDNLWIVIVIRSFLRILPVCILFLIPRSDPNASILPTEALKSKKGDDMLENKNMEMAPLVSSVDQHLVVT